MNTLARLDTALAAALYGLQSSKVPLPTPPSSPTLSSASGSPHLSNLPPSPRKRRAVRKRRAKPTTSSIKVPPPSTPFFLRIALALWSILLAFWRSLVGEIRAERSKRTVHRRRANTIEIENQRRALLNEGERQATNGVDGLGEDGNGTSDNEAEQDGTDEDGGVMGGEAASRKGKAAGEWTDPVTRQDVDGKVEGPSDDEFVVTVTREPEPIAFRLRSASKPETVKMSAEVDSSPPTPVRTHSSKLSEPFSVQPNPPGILSNSLSPGKTRQARLLPNPMSTSLLDPSVPAGQSSSAPPTVRLSAPPRLHQTPFHLRKTLILDLDETLIHSTSRPISYSASGGGGLVGLSFGGLLGKKREGHTVEVVLNGRSTTYHVYKRPYVDHFLKKVASWYTLVIFTASMPEYADPVIDWLDGGRGLFAKRYYRESCHLSQYGSYIKDLALVEKDLSRVCFMDNSPASYAWNKANALPIEGWTSDPYDEALLQSMPVLDSLRFVHDVRNVLGIRGFS